MNFKVQQCTCWEQIFEALLGLGRPIPPRAGAMQAVLRGWRTTSSDTFRYLGVVVTSNWIAPSNHTGVVYIPVVAELWTPTKPIWYFMQSGGRHILFTAVMLMFACALPYFVVLLSNQKLSLLSVKVKPAHVANVPIGMQHEKPWPETWCQYVEDKCSSSVCIATVRSVAAVAEVLKAQAVGKVKSSA